MGLVELSWVLGVDDVKQVHLLIGVSAQHEEDYKVLERLNSFSAGGVQELGVLVLRIINYLEGLGCVENHLLMDKVLDHEAIVLDLLLLESFLIEMLLGDLAGEDLATYEISPLKHKLHLVEDEVDLLGRLKRAVGLDLDLLHQLRGIVDLSITLKHLSLLSHDL